MNRRLLLRTTLAAVALALALGDNLHATAPPNDAAHAAAPLKGADGMVRNASNVGATVEKGEDQVGDLASIWYLYTAEDEGYLTVHYDEQNDQGGTISVECREVTHPINFSRSLPNTADRVSPGGGRDLILPLAAGGKVLVGFNSTGGTGVFNFSYHLATRGGFAFSDPPQQVGPNGGCSWIFNRSSASTAHVTIHRYGSTFGSASVDYQISDETSDPKLDYSFPATGTVAFAPGETSRTLAIPLSQRSATVTFRMTLLNPSANGVVLGTSSSVAVAPYQNEIEVTLEDGSAPPSNDAFASAISLPASPTTVTLPPGLATVEAGEPGYCDRSVWYRWTAPHGGTLELSAGVAAYSLPLIVFTGDTMDSLAPLTPSAGSVNGGYGPQIHPSYQVVSGETYSIAVLNDDGQGAALHGGAYQLNAQFTPASSFYFASPTIYALAPLKKPYAAAQLTVLRNDTTVEASIDFATSTGTGSGDAVGGRDFTPTMGTLTFPIGVASQAITIPLAVHTKKIGPVKFQVDLLPAPSGFGPAQASVQIFEDQLTYLARAYSTRYGGVWTSQLLSTTSGVDEGFISLVTTDGGSFTGTLSLVGRVLPIKGSFPPTLAHAFGGPAQVTTAVDASKAGDPGFRLNLTFDRSTAQPSISGEVLAQGTLEPVATFQLKQRQGDYPVNGLFTFAGSPDAQAPTALQAPIYGSVKIDGAGMAKLTGVLPDGSKFSGGGMVSQAEEIQKGGDFLYHLNFGSVLPKGGGLVEGEMRFAVLNNVLFCVAPAGDGDGRLRWIRPASTGTHAAPGFVTEAVFAVSHAASLLGSKVLLAPFPSAFSLTEAGPSVSGGSQQFQIQLGKGNKVTSSVVNGATVTKFNGFVDGTFTGQIKAAAGPAVTFGGALFPNLGGGSGSFFLNGSAGMITLSP